MERSGSSGLVRSLVDVRLVESRRVRVAGIPVRCRRIIVSVCDPQALLADLG